MNNIFDPVLHLDSRNREIFELEKSKFLLDFKRSANWECSVYSVKNTATIFIPAGDFCIDSLTHELLHLFIEAHEVYIRGSLKLIMRQDPMLDRVFDEALSEHDDFMTRKCCLLQLFQHGR
ncbi:hypothetical protein J7E50_10130 [Pedobacter sp. ISL-68]|uniref:hypothetical protein n=1 Tax=unclassified Pedobacter TaxID=2628915 RepID=UPI001BE82196|nr:MULTISPECIES: hypothetical protein [unclassified Pedobacter]MBT2561188.1 hypothetical protein [Pedobacter sp. ISL-64]MBT2590577.1 hypothetical protein [Pedobacter sp. ISL-68]